MPMVTTVDCTSSPPSKVGTAVFVNSKQFISTSNFRNTMVSSASTKAVILKHSSSTVITTEHIFMTSMDFIAIIISFGFTTLLVE